jgi:ketosteroid isomerase-like protein
MPALRRYVESWLAAFPDLRIDAEELIDAGDWALAVTRLVGSGGASGAAVNDVYVFAGRVEDGKFVELREYGTKGEALEAVARVS